MSTTSSGSIILTVCSTKGGVGKSTLTANIGALLADAGHRVLLVDTDSQATLSHYFAVAEPSKRGITAFLTEGDIESTVARTSAGCDLIRSDHSLGELQNWVLHTPDGRVRMKYTLSQVNWYDFILIDTQGAVGPLQDAAVLAADLLLSPIVPHALSAREFARGTLAMIDRLKPMQHLGAPVGPLYGAIYKMDRTAEASRIAGEFRKESFVQSRGSIRILETVVPESVSYREAATSQLPVHRYEKSRRGVMRSAHDVMVSLVRELFPHVELNSALDGEAEGGQ